MQRAQHASAVGHLAIATALGSPAPHSPGLPHMRGSPQGEGAGVRIMEQEHSGQGRVGEGVMYRSREPETQR